MWAPEFDKYEMCLTSFYRRGVEAKGQIEREGGELVGGVGCTNQNKQCLPCLLLDWGIFSAYCCCCFPNLVVFVR